MKTLADFRDPGAAISKFGVPSGFPATPASDKTSRGDQMVERDD
jgi:hypothetical protein